MSSRTRFHAAISALAMASTLTACAAGGGHRVAKASDYRDKSVKVGLATKALAALTANDTTTAISLAEQAVAQNPGDAGFRTLLGNSYFAAGRFVSAEQAFKDSLSLYPDQAQVMLKLALVQIAQGKTTDALAFLDFAKSALDPADYGLALALAGRPNDAIPVLRQAAADRLATARDRQNLALAYALAGDWVNARVVAEHDVSPTEIDQRIQDWMQFAGKSSQPGAQVAALIGVNPAAADPGEPVQLALVKQDTQTAQAAAPAPVAEPMAPAPDVVAYVPPPIAPMPEPVAAAEPPAQQAPQVGSLTVKLPEAAPAIVAAAPTYVPPQDFPYVEVKQRPRAKAVIAANKPPVKRGSSSAVVQLGAYKSPQRVAAAWSAVAKRYGGLKNFRPVSARFVTASGPVYRLSVQGFGSPVDASRLCGSIKRAGGNCFVRTVAGDRPVQLAMR